jgi:hypothetical protein
MRLFVLILICSRLGSKERMTYNREKTNEAQNNGQEVHDWDDVTKIESGFYWT